MSCQEPFPKSVKFFLVNAYQVFYLGTQQPGVHFGVLQQSPDDFIWMQSFGTHICLLILGLEPDGGFLCIATLTTGNPLEGALEVPWRTEYPATPESISSFIHSTYTWQAPTAWGTVLGGRSSTINRT